MKIIIIGNVWGTAKFSPVARIRRPPSLSHLPGALAAGLGSSLTRVEILCDPVSSLHGSGVLGGVDQGV